LCAHGADTRRSAAVGAQRFAVSAHTHPSRAGDRPPGWPPAGPGV